MGLFDNMRRRQKARQKRRGKRQSARQTRRQTRAAGRFDPEVLAARQAGRQQLMGQALAVGAGMLGQDEALAAYTGGAPTEEYIAMDYEEPGISPLVIGVGVVALAGILVFAMKK